MSGWACGLQTYNQAAKTAHLLLPHGPNLAHPSAGHCWPFISVDGDPMVVRAYQQNKNPAANPPLKPQPPFSSPPASLCCNGGSEVACSWPADALMTAMGGARGTRPQPLPPPAFLPPRPLFFHLPVRDPKRGAAHGGAIKGGVRHWCLVSRRRWRGAMPPVLLTSFPSPLP
jgi:hypothetical protein